MTFDEQSKELSYLRAKKRVKDIKGFYTHLVIYLGMNVIISALNMFLNHDIYDSKTFFTALTHFSAYMTWVLWGIGLLIHGLKVFWLRSSFFKRWEDRKLQEFLNEEAQEIRNRYE